MKTATTKRKAIADAVELLKEESPNDPGNIAGVQLIPIEKVRAFKDHPFHMYEGERLDDMVQSVRDHGILNPVIVRKVYGGYEMLAGHNRMNAAQIAGMTEVPAIVKTDLSDEEAYIYVIETNVIQRSFTDLAPSEKAAEPEVKVPFLVKVSISDLNIRKGPGIGYDRVQFCPPGVYTIVAVSDGAGATKWGKLKSGIGWLSLDFVTKV